MITDVCQRWNKRKSSYRPAGELGRVNPHDYEVAPIDGDGSDTIVKAFVEEQLPSGQVFSPRTISKIRTRDKGWRYGVAQLVEAGAVEPADLSVEGLRAWLGVEVRRITKPVRHPGNHRYLFGLTPACKRHLPASLPYPKIGRREVEL